MTPEERLNENQKFNRAYEMRRGDVNPLVGFFDGLDRALTGRYQRRLPPSGLTAAQQKALIEGTEGAAARVARIKAESDALVDAARKDPNHPYHNLFQQAPVTLSDDASARESALTAMRQQYAPGSQFFETEAGQAMIQQAKNNQYTGDAAGLAEFNMNQRKVGIGAIDEIIDAMGYAGTPMEEWARANEGLALREYNKKFGGPAEYAGTGPSDEEIKAAMEAGQFFPSEGSPNPLGKTGENRETNTAQTEALQQGQRRPFVSDEAMPVLRGKSDFYNEYKKFAQKTQ